MPFTIVGSNGVGNPARGVNPDAKGDNKTQETTGLGRNIKEAPPPPPLRSAGDPPNPAKGKRNEEHLAAIRKGVALKKVTTRVKDTKPEKTASAEAKFLPASEYIDNCSWDYYKEQIVNKITESKGQMTENRHLNSLMVDHAKFAKKTGMVNAVVSDRDASGQVQEHKEVRKSEYVNYVLGREQKIDRNNDFNQNISGFLDRYMHDLAEGAKKENMRLKDRMEQWFGIATKVQSPQSFFRENRELRVQLDKTGFDINHLAPEDITESFVEGLIDYDTQPKKIDEMLEIVFSRELTNILKREGRIRKAITNHRERVMRQVGVK